MAIRNILKSDNPLLKSVSKPVKVFDERLWELLDDMYQTMVENKGAGIAAPQVGVLRRAFIVSVNKLKLEMVNPEIIEEQGACTEVEGCLSVEKIQGYVQRPEKVTVKAFDRYGNPYTFTATDWMARAICHENDHLNGILFTELMTEAWQESNTD